MGNYQGGGGVGKVNFFFFFQVNDDRRVFLAESDLRIWGFGILKDTHAYLDSILWFVLE